MLQDAMIDLLPDRILAKIDIGDDCWNWTAAKNARGYGVVRVMGKIPGGHNELSHRYIYRVTVGEIPEGMSLDHLCRNPACCNPDHLEPVSHSENMKRARLTHCKNGHEFTEDNTSYSIDKKGRKIRHCKQCSIDWDKRNPEKKKARYQKWAEANRDEYLEIRRKRYAENREHAKAKTRDWRDRNREHFLAQQREYRAKRRAMSLD